MSLLREYLPYILTSVVGPLVTVLVLRMRARVDAQAREEALVSKAREAALEAQAEPMRILREELGKRESELAELRRDDREKRAKYVETLTAMQKALESIAADMKASREEGRQQSARLDQRLDIVDDRLLVIETRLGKEGT